MIVKNHDIELKDTSASEMARFRQIMLSIWRQQIEDDKNSVEMNTFIQQLPGKKKSKKKKKAAPAICKNIYIALDYDGTATDNDKKREFIEFKKMERSGWKGIYATNIQNANEQLTKYLNGTKVNNILLETHGAPIYHYNAKKELIRTGAYLSVDNNNHNQIKDTDLSDSIAQTNTQNQNDVDALIGIITEIKPYGNFYLQSCNTAGSDLFFNNLRILTKNTVNLFGSTGFCGPQTVTDEKQPTTSIYTPSYLFKRNTIASGMGKLYQAGCENDPPILLKGIEIDKSGITSY